MLRQWALVQRWNSNFLGVACIRYTLRITQKNKHGRVCELVLIVAKEYVTYQLQRSITAMGLT